LVINRRQAIGRKGEAIACQYLLKKGYTVLAKNVRTPYGEIDLIVSQNDVANFPEQQILIFVEVKARTSYTFGFPEDSIAARKKNSMLASIQYYLQEHSEIDSDWQIDVIAINLAEKPDETVITHFPNAISSETEGI
jgi:putative endonuclease